VLRLHDGHHAWQVNCLQITPDKQFIAAAGNPHIRLFEVAGNASPNPVRISLLLGILLGIPIIFAAMDE
jgi:hypothetical protein